MKNGLVVADAGPIFSLAVIDKLSILNKLFDDVKIPEAVWKEITYYKSSKSDKLIYNFFKNKVRKISGFNDLSFLMDYGESESVILYKELKARFLLIDDKKARKIAESLKINCIGSLGILTAAKEKDLISKLHPLFMELLKNERFYSIDLLNSILKNYNEELITKLD